MGARSGPDLEEALPRFLLRCEHDVARRAYRAAVTRFWRWADRLEPGVLERYADHLRARGFSESMVRWQLVVLGEFLEYARERGLVAADEAGPFPGGGSR
ncbi:MAG: hypothetical protein FJY88_08970 [Candidatus Eisenbacteria bacterium]|nr:hypothetical protein [Candidatus Eisenbacteria bacterium]